MNKENNVSESCTLDPRKASRRVLYLAANIEGFNKIFNRLREFYLLRYCDPEEGLARFISKDGTSVFFLCRYPYNLMRIGRVHELYFDSNCNIFMALNVFAPLCNLPGAKPFEVIEVDKIPQTAKSQNIILRR